MAIDKGALSGAGLPAMLRAFSSSLGQIADPAIVRVIIRSLLLTLLAFVALGAIVIVATRTLVSAYGGGAEAGLAAATVAGVAVIIGGWLLFRGVAIAVIGLFADEIVAAVEQRHYPSAAHNARMPGLWRSAQLALMSLVRLLLLNLLAIPLYGLLLVTAIGPVLLFFVINALLLGRDLGDLVAVRHLDSAAHRDWLRVTRGQRALMGAIVTGLFMIPIINLVAPVIGAGMATHLFHRRPS